MEEKNLNTKSELAQKEEKVLEFWREKNIFSKTLSKTKGKKEFVFYEGPPTANGKPGIHHLESRSFKDAIPRYKTMQGYHVRRKAGWDTHGLPVELQVEKKLGLNSKKAIEEYGIAKFNQECKESVWEYVDLWEKFTERIGYWVDKENAYVTYQNEYIESVWNVISEADKQGLLYKDYKVVPWCPRCGTALSSHELAQGYETVKDLSVTAKFRLVSPDGFSQVLGSPSSQPDRSKNHTGSTFVLAWTTTPWTLPGNLALAVGKDIDYVKVKVGEDLYILAKSRLSVLENYEIVAEMKGSDLVGLEYEPLYPFIKENYKGDGLEKAFKIYSADFVTTEDGTGVVHTAVMYGQDDFELGTSVGLPKSHMVGLDGRYIDGAGFLGGRFVRDEETAVEIIKDLAHRGLLFKKEKYEHSYPFCWRCKTGLIYYARDSWYVRMSDPKIKKALIEENKKINWEPEHTRDGRFGEWLKDIKDWAISRERYWGTPLPVWLSSDGDKIVVDSLTTLKKYSRKSGNKYFVMRHGGTEGNLKGMISYKKQATDNLTPAGERQTEKASEALKKSNIDLIITSHFTRTKETADIVRRVLGLPSDAVIEDPRLAEMNPGTYDGKKWKDYHYHMHQTGPKWFERQISEGESFYDVKKRTARVLYELEEKYKGKNILMVTHGAPAWLLFVNAGLYEPDDHEYQRETERVFIKDFKNFKNAEVRELPFVPLPHNENFDADFHRPYIDSVVLEKDGKEFHRTKEVMDVWLDSGAMPFAQDHYPTENKKWVEGKGYPADYISEAIDQTRGWFYTLHAVGVIMGFGRAYKNVICLGHLLDANGKKMSKSLGNIVDPWTMADKYGIDTLRLWMYSVNQPGESKNFDEKTVLELQRQTFGLLYNVLAFYELYRDKKLEKNTRPKSKNVLDIWILARLDELALISTKNLESYKLLEPVRALKDFIGDLSTWYVRRSRERIKDGDKDAKSTLYFVLKNLVKIMAPFAPFATEDIWQRLKGKSDEESVHLSSWPKLAKPNKSVLDSMRAIREFVSLGLKARQVAGVQVRQPLFKIKIKSAKLPSPYTELIKDELNVKEVTSDSKIPDIVDLDTTITPELKEEGDFRELVRALQDERKKLGLKPNEKVQIDLSATPEAQALIKKFEPAIKKALLALKLQIKNNTGQDIKVGKLVFKVKITRKKK